MKKPLLCWGLCGLLLFSGCSPSSGYFSGSDGTQDSNTFLSSECSSANSEKMQTDFYYICRYVRELDICLNQLDTFYFNSPEELPIGKVFTYFVYITKQENLYDYETWYDQKQELYIFPAEYVVDTIKRYLDFDCSDELYKESYYNASTGNMEVPVFGGFGGYRTVKLRSKNKENNLLTLVADFYDDDGMCYNSIKYTIEENINSFIYRKIERVKPE